ncbi:MAG: RNA methyltransferase [Candidatus Binataceae bacterium]
MADIFLALVHHPVVDRNGRIITSAITSLDLHDLARSSRTYGVRAVYVIHPVPEQREFARSVIDHWRIGYGRSFDSRRVEALDLIEVVTDLEAAVAAAERAAGQRPAIVHTSAREEKGISFAVMRSRLAEEGAAPVLILLGTGFGLAPAVRERAGLALEAIRGAGDYNHLSVRAAASIILDRLRGR